MYEVFINETPLIISSSIEKNNSFCNYEYNDIDFKDIIIKIEEKKCAGIFLKSKNLEKDWIDFTTNFEVVVASGGVVLNDKNEVLFIFRNNKWDLPKGKVERGESIKVAALREVEEECGVANLVLKQKITTTYHTYNYNGLKLKKTHWFLMETSFNGKLIPQQEEGITKAVFKDEKSITKALQNSYKNIQLVYDSFKYH